MKMYEYMLLYLFPNGSGKTYITRDKKLRSIKDMEELDDWLKSDECTLDLPKELKIKAYVSDFKLLRTYNTFK